MRAGLLVLLAGCGAVGQPDAGAPDAGLWSTPHAVSAALAACAQLQGEPVDSVVGAVARFNALPQPPTVPCLVASLPRPLRVVGTTSRTSAQPAVGPSDPRLFLLGPALTLSVVGAGDGAHLVELGQWVSSSRTLKGEVSLPYTAPLDAGEPFARVRRASGGTECGLCHRYEVPDPSMNGGYVSDAYQPASTTEVSLAQVAALHRACVDTAEASDRCELLHAVFDLGEARQGAFAADVGLFLP